MIAPGKMIDVGRYTSEQGSNGQGLFGGQGLRIVCDAPELDHHADKPWFRAYAAERLDIPLSAMAGDDLPAGTAAVGHDQLARHACVCGATGSGKTRLALHLLAEQIRAGCSVVMLDPKIETIRHLMTLAFQTGMDPGQVTVLSPYLSGAGAPGWNPLDVRASGVPPAQAAADVVSVLASSTSSWGPRMGDLLANALVIIASHGLSLFELARLLQRDDYREGLLRLPLPHGEDGSRIAFDEARDYFLSEFAAWSKSERSTAVAPVLNKFRELLRTPFLRSLLCARRTTLNLGALWHRPGLVLVHLDAAALGDEGVRLLGGLLAHQLLRTAMRSDGPVPVVLSLDEMGVSEEFVGGAAAKILAIARSRGLRLLVACQHLAQLSDGLRSALLANTAVQAFFRLGYADAKLVAASLAAGTGERVSRIAADVGKRDKDGLPDAWAEVSHTLRDSSGDPIRLSLGAIQAFGDLARKGGGLEQVEGLKLLAKVSGIDRLYVHAADTKVPVEVTRYLRGVSPAGYWISGTGPVRLIVTFPRPRLSVLSRETETERGQRWLRTLTELPVQRAVVRLAPGQSLARHTLDYVSPGSNAMAGAAAVQVIRVSDPIAPPGFERFLSAAVAGSGQAAREVEQAQEWRREEVERIAGGRGTLPDHSGKTGQSTHFIEEAPPKRSSRRTPTVGIQNKAASREPDPNAESNLMGSDQEPAERNQKQHHPLLPAQEILVAQAVTIAQDGSLA